MNLFIKNTLCCLLFAFISPVFAAVEAADTLTDLLADMRAFKAEFKQITLDGRGSHLQELSGTIAVKRPGLFYWQTEPPFEQQVVSDGERLWFYDPDLEQVTVQALDHRLTQTPALLLSGEVDSLKGSYRISGDQTHNGWVFTLLPKDAESLFEQLKLTFTEGRLIQMHLKDSLGKRSSFEFLNPQINLELAPELFQFTPPDGVDIISQ